MSVWNDVKLREWAMAGGVTPFEPSMINPASIDLRLSNRACRLAENYGLPYFRYGDKAQTSRLWCDPETFTELPLYPGRPVLLSTMERTAIPDNAVAALYSKSTAGRCLLEHFHAGYGDAGFNGNWTLEIVNWSPVVWVLKPGDRLVQLVIADMVDAALNPYHVNGRYQGQTLPTAPKGWEVEEYHCG